MKMLLALIAIAGLAAPAYANCRIKNETKWDFTIESGNTSNQRVGPNTTTSIQNGTIKGTDKKAGKTISGSCKNGDSIKIIDDRGVPTIVPNK